MTIVLLLLLLFILNPCITSFILVINKLFVYLPAIAGAFSSSRFLPPQGIDQVSYYSRNAAMTQWGNSRNNILGMTSDTDHHYWNEK